MSTPFCIRLTGLLLLATLPSCGLIKAPFKVAGAVVDGTAYVGKKAYDASAAPFKDTPEEKAEKEKEKAAKEKEKAAKDAKDKAAKEGQGTTQPGTATEPALPQATPSPSGNTLPPPPEGQTPSNDYLPPVPGDQPPPGSDSIPYQR